MIILTGGAGFIGTNILIELNKKGEKDILVVDNIEGTLKGANLKGLKYREYVNKNNLWDWLATNKNTQIDAIIHLGACSDTTEMNLEYLYKNNVEYSQKLWKQAVEMQVPFIYASSAATYGDGSLGFSDDHDLIPKLKPLNPYGQSKQDFDLWVLKQKQTPPTWIGLKYFNVFGPFEAHKGRMASMAWHGYNQIKETGKIRLFKSHREDYKDGEQLRDFIYVKDAVNMTLAFFDNDIKSGIYNVGTGKARTFNDMVLSLFKAINIKPDIEFFDIPKDIKKKYQYYTMAENNKSIILRSKNFKYPTLEDGIKKYIQFLEIYKF